VILNVVGYDTIYFYAQNLILKLSAIVLLTTIVKPKNLLAVCYTKKNIGQLISINSLKNISQLMSTNF
jgi:hypothetical protein